MGTKTKATLPRAEPLLLAFVVLMGCATSPLRGSAPEAGSGGGFPADVERPLTCAGVSEASDGPDFGSGDAEALLAPFLSCPSPAHFVASQRRVDMSRLVASLDPWSAVRLGALGPVREEAAEVLQRQRVAFLLAATERYGLRYAEVFALFVLHSAHDDEVDAILRQLARDKRLGQTLALMPGVREELERRGLGLSAYADRAEQSKDVWRGLGRAARDALATSPVSDGLRSVELAARAARLPPPYQEALHEVERALARQHFAPGSVVLGGFDALTFGVPLGFTYLVAGTGQGLSSLSRGQYEQATRELTPAALGVALYAGGRGLRAGFETRAPLRDLGRWWESRLGVEGVRTLFGHLRARRDAAHFVAAGGVDAALALGETRGDVARAQVWLSQAKSHPGGGAGVLASLVDERAGLTREVMEARLARVEQEAVGPRLSTETALLREQSPSVGAPPPGAGSNPRWAEYVAYYERRVQELERGVAAEGPLRWAPYERMWGGFTRGLEFERTMVKRLRADAALPRAQRRLLQDFDTPRVETCVGVYKPEAGLRYADVLVIEAGETGGQPRRVETFSFKSRDFVLLDERDLRARMAVDAREALGYYGETVDIRRHSLSRLVPGDGRLPVMRVRLIYEGGALQPKRVDVLKGAIDVTRAKIQGVEVSIQ